MKRCSAFLLVLYRCVIHAHKSDDGIINMAVCIAGRRGIGKAKYKDGVHQKPLVLLE